MQVFPQKSAKFQHTPPGYELAVAQKKSPSRLFFSSATRTRTGVYGVRGRCPRPLDDSTQSVPLYPIKIPFDGVLIGEEFSRQLYELHGNEVIDLRKRRQKYCFFLTYANIFEKKCIFTLIFLQD